MCLIMVMPENDIDVDDVDDVDDIDDIAGIHHAVATVFSMQTDLASCLNLVFKQPFDDTQNRHARPLLFVHQL